MQSTLPQNNQRKRRRGLGSLIFSVVLIGLSIVIWLNRQYIVDSISFWQYSPSTTVANITERIKLSDTGKFAFYASQPTVDGSRAFNATCDRKEENTAILGCYAASRIYIFDVQDTRLDGIEEVTAAHELLHAIYQRLPEGEKANVNRLVEAEYEKLRTNPDFAERMAFYDRTEPGERDNELHSIIGTEIGPISSELEAHYAKYFTDRSRIVGFYAAYNKVFTALSDRAKELSAQLDTLSAQIKDASAKYNNDIKQLNADIAQFNQRANSGDFTSQAQFNTQRQALVARVNALAQGRDSVNAKITEYNRLKDEYNNTVTQSNQLYKSIDSSLAPAPKV